MPLVLLAPGSRASLRWRGDSVGQLPLAALLLLLLPLGLTFYAWKATTENNYQRGEAKFETLTIESEKALQNRLASYGNALLGAAGFIQGSPRVSREAWRTYVETIQVRENFPGMQRHRLDRAAWRLTDLARVPRRRARGRRPGFRRSTPKSRDGLVTTSSATSNPTATTMRRSDSTSPSRRKRLAAAELARDIGRAGDHGARGARAGRAAPGRVS